MLGKLVDAVCLIIKWHDKLCFEENLDSLLDNDSIQFIGPNTLVFYFKKKILLHFGAKLRRFIYI